MNKANKNKAKNKLNYISGTVISISLWGEGSVLSDLILLYSTNYMLHDQFDTQNQDIRQTFVQPLEEASEL